MLERRRKGQAQLAEELKRGPVVSEGAELEEERNGRAAEVERVKALEGELSGVKGELDARRRRKGRRSSWLRS